jgi:hypothetical protein
MTLAGSGAAAPGVIILTAERSPYKRLQWSIGKVTRVRQHVKLTCDTRK